MNDAYALATYASNIYSLIDDFRKQLILFDFSFLFYSNEYKLIISLHIWLKKKIDCHGLSANRLWIQERKNIKYRSTNSLHFVQFFLLVMKLRNYPIVSIELLLQAIVVKTSHTHTHKIKRFHFCSLTNHPTVENQPSQLFFFHYNFIKRNFIPICNERNENHFPSREFLP